MDYEVSFKSKDAAWYIRNRLHGICDFCYRNEKIERPVVKARGLRVIINDRFLNTLEKIADKIGARYEVSQKDD